MTMPEPLPHDLDRMAAARAYNEWIISRARPWLRGRVLDVGAGVGTHTSALAASAESVVALEPDPQLAQLLRENAATVAEVVVGDITAVEGPFDVVAAFNVLEHIPDDRAELRRIRDLLAPDGRVLLLVPAHGFLFGSLDRTFGHERRYTTRTLREKLLEAGLVPRELRYVNPAGGAAWLLHSRVLKSAHLPARGVALFDRLVPLFRAGERLPLPFGLSVWAVAEPRPAFR
jgi:SAM-dependent methyltransferase